MDLEVIERLMQMLSNSDVEELEVTEGNLRIRLAKGSAVRGKAAGVPVAPESGRADPAEHARGLKTADDDVHTIVAGLPGTFYRAPAPGTARCTSARKCSRIGRANGAAAAILSSMRWSWAISPLPDLRQDPRALALLPSISRRSRSRSAPTRRRSWRTAPPPRRRCRRRRTAASGSAPADNAVVDMVAGTPITNAPTASAPSGKPPASRACTTTGNRAGFSAERSWRVTPAR